MKNAITYDLSGRLGNNLQLWGCARAISLRYGFKFIFKPFLHYNKFNLCFGYRDGFELIKSQFIYKNRVILDDHVWDETGNVRGLFKEEYLQQKDTLFILKWGGIFTDLSECKDVIIKELSPKIDQYKYPTRHNDVGVHIRRGDTSYPLPMNYYINSINRIKHKLDTYLTLHLFSDGNHEDLAQDLCSKIGDIDVKIHKGTVVDDLLSLSRYPSIIISMSWYSYWAAFISTHSDIYAPKDFCYYSSWNAIDY